MKTTSLEQSGAMIPNGTTLMTDGFMSVGTPERVVDELAWREKRSLAVIAHDTATPDCGIGKLVAAKRVRKAIVSRCHSEQISGRFAIASIRMSQGQSCHQWRER